MFQKDLLQAKRILITGGGTGLGKAAAQRFLELGAEVYLCGRRQDVLAATEQELHERTGGSRDHKKIHTLPCDVRDAAAVEELIGAIWAEGPLDVLMNNAAGNFLSRTEDLSLGAFQSVIGIVLLARCTRRWRADGAGWPKAGRCCAQHHHHLHDDGLGLRCAVGGGEGGRACPYAQFGRRMGESRDSDERDRAWADSHRGCILAPAAPARTGRSRQEAHSSGTIRHHRGIRQSGRIPG